MWRKAQHQISMEQFYVFMVNSFWDSANIVLGCLRESTHLHMLRQCQMIVRAFNHHMNECQGCLKALEQCGLNWILPPWRWGAGALLSFLLRKGDEKEGAAELEWRVRGKTDVGGKDWSRKAWKVWSVTAASSFLVSSQKHSSLSHWWQGMLWVSSPLLQAVAPAGTWPFYLSFCLLFPQTASQLVASSFSMTAFIFLGHTPHRATDSAQAVQHRSCCYSKQHHRST